MDARRKIAQQIIQIWYERALEKSYLALEAEETNLPLQEAGVIDLPDPPFSSLGTQAAKMNSRLGEGVVA